MLRLALLAAASILASIAWAQVPATAIVVSACGTPAATYPAGQFQPITMDTNGNLCIKSCAVSLPVTYTAGQVYQVALDTDGQACIN